MNWINQDLWLKMKPLLITLLGFFYLYIIIHLTGICLAAGDKKLKSPISYPAVKFAVISDIHLFDINKNVDHPYYSHYGAEDRKLLQMSEEILERAVAKINKEEVEFVVITGDLTDIGDFQSHYLVASILQQLQDNGIKVFVVPGNHDGFIVDKQNGGIRDLVSPEDFASIYHNFGYKEVIYEDDESLSYVIEPVPGLWLLIIDSCIYGENRYHVTGGRIQETTSDWINEVLDKALADNKSVMGFMHHGIVEHFAGQQKFFSEYLVNDCEKFAHSFAAKNLQIFFTGHNHALDIVKQDFSQGQNDKTDYIYDIETSSLIGYPNAFRLIEINEKQELFVKTEYIKELSSFAGDFSFYTKNYVKNRIKKMASAKLAKFKVNNNDKEKITDQVTAAILAHYEGNEIPTDNLKIEGINFWSKIIMHFYKELINGLWHDLEPDDINIKINLKTGAWERYNPGE